MHYSATVLLCTCLSLAATPLPAQDTAHALPEYQLQNLQLPDSQILYQRTLDCWPSASHFRVELSLEGRVGQSSQSWIDPNGRYMADISPLGASLVARLPLYSANELDREREREWLRRRRAAEAVGQLITHLADRQRIRQELNLMKTLEVRARKRVISGIVDSSEQVRYMERVAELDGQLLRQQGHIERSRLELLGFCGQTHFAEMDRYLRTQIP